MKFDEFLCLNSVTIWGEASKIYNDSIEKYEATRKSLFESMVVSMASGKLLKQFVYWGISDEQRKAQEEYKVKL